MHPYTEGGYWELSIREKYLKEVQKRRELEQQVVILENYIKVR
jgi:hypothetical protein